MISFQREQVFLVTGASSGIGEDTALRLNALGATVIANGRNVQKLQDNKARAAFPDAFHVEPRDIVQNMESLPQWITDLRKKYGKFSGLVCCAGYNLMAPFRDFQVEDARNMFDVHFHAPMLLAKGVSDRRNCVGQGTSLVFLSSICAIVPLRMLSIYAAAKGALMAAARCMSKELGGQGVRVNCICPALVRTPMTENYSNAVMGFDVLAHEDTIYPLGVSEVEDISAHILFLLSPASRKITGQHYIIDGGRH